MSNYPDDMNQWNNEPTSPFYEEETDEEMSKMMSNILEDDDMQAELSIIQEELERLGRLDEDEAQREAEYYMELMENSYSAWNQRFDNDR